jgi:hypothetical protein
MPSKGGPERISVDEVYGYTTRSILTTVDLVVDDDGDEKEQARSHKIKPQGQRPSRSSITETGVVINNILKS